MRKIIITFLIIFITTNIFAQEKGLHLTLGGNIGRTNFKYKLENGTPKPDLGFGASIGAQYYFTEYLGLSLGLDLSVFNTKSSFNYDKNNHFFFPNVIDREEQLCDITTLLLDWTESQRTYFLDIPLLMRFQYKWGRKEMHGFYLGLGVKLQAPVSSTYKKSDGTIAVSAYYPDLGLTLGEEGLSVFFPHHGLGTNKDIFWSGKSQLKMGCAIAGEAGFLIGLSRRVDLTLGVSADYGFLNIKKNSDELLEVVKNRTPQDGQVGEIVSYNGTLNSNKTNMIHPASVRATLGLKIKIGKLKERDDIDDQTKKLAEILSNMEGNKGKRDTIIVNPVVVPIYMSSQNGEERGEAGQRPVNYYESNGTNDGSGNIRARRGAPVPQEVIDLLEESIFFALDKYNLDAEAIAVLDRKVAQMKKYPHVVISVVGHTCNLGTGVHNDDLSRNRALAARFYMINKGVKPYRIEIIPMGQHYPSYPNTTEDSRSLNRRVDFIFNQ